MATLQVPMHMLRRANSDFGIYELGDIAVDADVEWSKLNLGKSRTPPPCGCPAVTSCEKKVGNFLAQRLFELPPRKRPRAPLVIEDPPSSDDNEDDDISVLDQSLLNGSSSNLSPKSAPPTPYGDRLAGPFIAASPPTSPVPKSPSHVFSRHDRQVLKQLSSSTPVMTQASVRSSKEPDLVVTPGSSKARQKKFHRHFKQVAAEERVLNYYSCALVGDILLQGHLYITKNYFAFYSNVFGYVTKLLIPTTSVLKVTKEKTAKIIPNAVGVATDEEKHVFGSLLSRDSTYRLMIQVWKSALKGPALQDSLALPKVIKDENDSASGDINMNDEDSSMSGSGNDSAIERSLPPTPIDSPMDISHSESKDVTLAQCMPSTAEFVHNHIDNAQAQIFQNCTNKLNGRVPMKRLHSRIRNGYLLLLNLPRPTLLLLTSTVLLVLLFLSAAVLLYRINRIQHQMVDNPMLTSGGEVYQEILKWQTQLHSKSAVEVQQFLNSNLDQIAKVRQSLEALSLLIVADDGGPNRYHQQHHHQSVHPRDKAS